MTCQTAPDSESSFPVISPVTLHGVFARRMDDDGFVLLAKKSRMSLAARMGRVWASTYRLCPCTCRPRSHVSATTRKRKSSSRSRCRGSAAT